MFLAINTIMNNILRFGNYRSSEIGRKYFKELLIGLKNLKM